ncbi:type II toxin-antitoxin system RelE/ParE family toxin [Caldalkalibacillus mannanilyticus]|uniref:type II toxin-antitoxin system RelE/ParE family toxin n=1 Tax=Caldalkalibacillus mannanilyticus TaxID=1418 RepID=UPI000468FB8F|nr:type II toxin-antitoxin system RelE/ParE family toxin [Caldalkalibacillus mannanilyticus]
MVKTVIWSTPAALDLERAVTYIFEDSPAYAISFYNTVKERSRTLSELSERGRVVPEHNDNRVREIFIHRYRLIYEIKEEEVIILSFIHGAQLYNQHEDD